MSNDLPSPPPTWMPPTTALGETPLPVDSQPMASADRWALIALAVSLSVLGSCIIPGFGCLAPLVLGIVALVQAKTAVDPKRTRLYGWVAVGIGIVIMLFFIGIVIFYVMMIGSLINNPSFQNNLR